jgi:hypothetical protein
VLELLVEVVVAVALMINVKLDGLFRLLEVFCKEESLNTYKMCRPVEKCSTTVFSKVPLLFWQLAPTTCCQADRSSTAYLGEDISKGRQNLQSEMP